MKLHFTTMSLGMLAVSMTAQAGTMNVDGDKAANLMAALQAVPGVEAIDQNIKVQQLTCESGYLMIAHRSMVPSCTMQQQSSKTRSGEVSRLDTWKAEHERATELMGALREAGVKAVGVEVLFYKVNSIDCNLDTGVCTLEVP